MNGKLIEKLVSPEIRNGYTFTRQGIVTNPGKFEGESIATLYYYDCYLDGGEAVTQVTDEEREAFGLSDSDKWVYLAESNDGFVSLVYFATEDEAQRYEYAEQGIDIDEVDSLDEEY